MCDAKKPWNKLKAKFGFFFFLRIQLSLNVDHELYAMEHLINDYTMVENLYVIKHAHKIVIAPKRESLPFFS
jgi:hypothetical protein